MPIPRHTDQSSDDQGELIASFGEARLIKLPDRRYELLGGSEPDRAEAQKWIDMFMKNDVVKGAASPPGAEQSPRLGL